MYHIVIMTQPLYLHVLIYVLNFMSFEAITQASQVCLSSLPNFPDKFSSGHHEAIDRGVQVLLPSLVIECNGYITSWRAYIKDHKANTIHFQVWRPVSTNVAVQAYTLVNETIATVTGGPGRELIVVTPVDYIPVQSGDMIGIYQGSSHKGVRIKTVHDPIHDMRQYPLHSTPSIGSQISIDDLPHRKHKVPLLNITIVNHSVEVTSSIAESPSVVPSQSPNRPSSVSVSTSHPSPTSTEVENDAAQIQSPFLSTTNVLAEDCESASDGLTFLIMIILVMTIAILLLVVFVLGTALILVSVKLRQVKELNCATRNSRNNKSDTFVGKQVVIFEEGASSSFSSRLPTAVLSEGTGINQSNTTQFPLSGDSNMINSCAMANAGGGRQSHQQQACSSALPAATIDNPSYIFPREQCSTGNKHQCNTVCSVYKTPSIESRRAQEYENPQAAATPHHAPLSRPADNVLPKDIYSHPRHGRIARHVQD